MKVPEKPEPTAAEQAALAATAAAGVKGAKGKPNDLPVEPAFSPHILVAISIIEVKIRALAVAGSGVSSFIAFQIPEIKSEGLHLPTAELSIDSQFLFLSRSEGLVSVYTVSAPKATSHQEKMFMQGIEEGKEVTDFAGPVARSSEVLQDPDCTFNVSDTVESDSIRIMALLSYPTRSNQKIRTAISSIPTAHTSAVTASDSVKDATTADGTISQPPVVDFLSIRLVVLLEGVRDFLVFEFVPNLKPMVVVAGTFYIFLSSKLAELYMLICLYISRASATRS